MRHQYTYASNDRQLLTYRRQSRKMRGYRPPRTVIVRLWRQRRRILAVSGAPAEPCGAAAVRVLNHPQSQAWRRAAPYLRYVPQCIKIFAPRKDSDVQRGVTPGRGRPGDSSTRGLYIWLRPAGRAVHSRQGCAGDVGRGKCDGDANIPDAPKPPVKGKHRGFSSPRPMSAGYHGTIGMDAPGGRAWEFTLSKSSWTIRQLPGRG